MTKRKVDKAEQELRDIAAADESEYNRLVTENKKLQSDLRALRAKYGLPFTSEAEWITRAQSDSDFGGIVKEIDALTQKHGATKWRGPIRSLALLGRATVFFDSGLPGGTVKRRTDGTLEHEINLPLTFPANNPIAQEILANMRKRLDKSPCPPPIKGKSGKDDWRPVWEWAKRHPEVTHKEIAQALGFSHQYVRARLAELDNGK